METKAKRAKKRYIIIAAILALFVAIYFTLPYFILKNVNEKLAHMEGYRGHIDALHLDILHVGFALNGFKIEKLEGKVPVPFIYVDEISNTLEWKPLLKGKILGTMVITNPKVNFVKGPTKATTQTGTEGNWIETVNNLPKLTVNSLTVRNGKITYFDMYSKPKVEAFISEMDMKVTNLRNVVDNDKKLPSHLYLTGNSIGKGALEVNADLNILKEIPDFNVDFKFRKVHLPALNDLSRAYGNFDFEAGEFSLFMEAAMYESHLKGYVQPVLEKIDVLDWKKDKNETFLRKMWEGVIGGTFGVTSNIPKKQFATKIPFEGDIKDVKVGIFPSIINIFKNEFIKAYPKAVDNTIDFNSADKDKKK